MGLIILNIIIFAIGIALLVKGADWLVEASVKLAHKLQISDYVIAVTIISVGTSLPELTLSLSATLKNESGLILGNVIGSNAFNLLFILGLSAIIYPIIVKPKTVYWEIPFNLFSSLVLLIPFFGYLKSINFGDVVTKSTNLNQVIGNINYLMGTVLLLLLLIFVIDLLKYNLGNSSSTNKKEVVDSNYPYKKILFYLSIGLICLFIGGELTITSAIRIADALNINKGIIALSIIAIGTSLPELITSVVASIQKKSDIALGNIVGSSIFNICLILGVSTQLNTIDVRSENILGLIFLIAVNIYLLVSVVINKKLQIGKIPGIGLLVLYFVFAYLFII